ncbi:hypothetical protein [Psychrosphaera algicola]|uniref:Tryptophan synthase beta chain-like PALP domain-containing protein n=1 Tax=Psychrosphaera algicola TaxID=3023714 RepID=A0ABT5FG47_9GAMM|nr:hypothetical protein [Psychrosphaera sp. G1-22]MDC2889597.1 hypothetical protein [Psychrosphaera sp. G1-22]
MLILQGLRALVALFLIISRRSLLSATSADFPTIGFIRTDHIDSKNPTLRLAKDRGMTLIKLTRQEYRLRNDPGFITSLKVQYPDYLFVPEGGSNEAAGAGLKELADEIRQQCEFDRFAVAVGSGGTVSGLMDNLPHNGIGVAVVRDDTLITNLTKKYGNRLTLKYNPISGKYGKVTPELAEFCLDFLHKQVFLSSLFIPENYCLTFVYIESI